MLLCIQVAKVLESKDTNYPVGSLMVSHRGWCDKGKINPSKLPPTEKCMPAPDLKVFLKHKIETIIVLKEEIVLVFCRIWTVD